ncbi:TRAP transporter substrate-binding protein [Rhodovulum strictum]|uniref:C4-dicarboxylate ABC transporter substrate-binding protein n=1 Tax=Rhodovulum strictum TaxID=58314 RepID=A0A844BI91_9RHOB|nr:TRAP transporter substrate-binding protein [Rhodovulum strictum]MRH20683.1 C4-dicarboxylate ABC transporter substrate-binding protein [Rhodovulum strictum]
MTRPLTRRGMLATFGAALAAPALVGRADAAEVTLRLHHFMPATTTTQTKVFEPWAAELAEASGGRIAVQIYPAMQLGGKPPQLVDQTRNGIVDIAWTLTVYTPDRYLVAETLSLPFMATTAEQTSVAMQTLMDEFGQGEYAGVRPLAFHTHASGKFHMRRTAITGAADLRGQRVRSPNKSTGDLLAALGAEPVFFPVTEMVVGLSNGVIDGCCLPYEAVPALKLHELTREHSAAASGARGLYTNTFALVMNQRSYDRMPDDLRGVIDAATGPALSQRLGRNFDVSEEVGRKVVEDAGNAIHEIAADEIARWREMAIPVHAAWQAKLDAAGLDGAAIMARANALLDG